MQALTDALVAAFDAATSLCAFNGVRFDIPFLHRLQIPPTKLVAWSLKCTDLLEQFRLRRMGTCSLNELAAANGVELKSSDGRAAIGMAERGEWQKLSDYCAQDVAILCQMHDRRFLVHPRSRQLMDVKDYSHPDLYSDSVAATTPLLAPNHAELRLGDKLDRKLDQIIKMCEQHADRRDASYIS